MNKNIREINKDETDIVLNIWYQANLKAHNFIDKSYYDSIKQKTKEKFTNSKIYVFTENNIIKGFTLIKDNYIDELYVDIKYQNQKIGTKLIDFLKSIYKTLSLNVFKKNEKAINFYLKNKFIIVEENIEENTKEKGYFMEWVDKPIKKEKRDLYDKNLNKTNLTYYKGDPIPENYYPMVVMIAIQNKEGKFLMQKRVPEKGGDYGVTGGHPKSGETPYEGIITEVYEELGIDISDNEIVEFNSGCDGTECYKMYYTNLDIDINNLEIQKEELSEVKWFSIKELEEMVKTKELNQNQIDFFIKCQNYINKTK